MATMQATDANGDVNDGQNIYSTPGKTEETSVDVAHGHTPNGDNADIPDDEAQPTLKKKKKKKTKKPSKSNGTSPAETPKENVGSKPPVLCISRNKHWKYISSYHVSLFCLIFSCSSRSTDVFICNEGPLAATSS